MDNTIRETQALIRRRLAELNEERGRLEKALAALGEQDSPQSPPSPTRRSRRSSGKRAARGQREKQLLAEIKKNPGAPVAGMARAIGVPPQQLYPLTKRLAAAGKIERGESGWKPKTTVAAKN